MDPSRFIPGDATLIDQIVNVLKAKGIFDEFRHECLADVDTKVKIFLTVPNNFILLTALL